MTLDRKLHLIEQEQQEQCHQCLEQVRAIQDYPQEEDGKDPRDLLKEAVDIKLLKEIW